MEGEGGGSRTSPLPRAARPRRDLIERLIQLRGQRRLVGEERERQAEALRGLGLNQVQRLAGGVDVLLQNPVLDLRAAIGEDDLVELVLDRGLGLERRQRSAASAQPPALTARQQAAGRGAGCPLAAGGAASATACCGAAVPAWAWEKYW